MATIQDVAKQAQVGVGTVSRVLNGNGYVKKETRDRIEQAIAALDYTPNQMARNLFFSRSGIVAVIVPEAGHPFFAQFVSAVEAALCEKGYQTMICNTYYEKNYELRYLDLLKQKRVDGIIFCAHTTQDISHYKAIKRPIVALDWDLGEEDIPCVMADHETGGRMAAKELIRSGCRNVIQVGSTESTDKVATPSHIRYQVFEETMKEHGIPCRTVEGQWPTADIRFYQKEAERIFESYPDIDGFFATDMMVLAMLRTALARGKRVPNELKLVAYDGTNCIGLAYPQITAVVQPIAQLAQKAAQLVVGQIEGGPIREKRVRLPVYLCAGDTTARA